MELCGDGHEEICFDCRNCPVCEAQDEIADLEDRIIDLENEIDELRTEIDNG